MQIRIMEISTAMCATMDTAVTKTIATVVTKNKVCPGGVVPEHLFPFSPDGSFLGPSGSHVGCVDGVDEHSGKGYTAMRNGVGFDKAGAGREGAGSIGRDPQDKSKILFGRFS
jgi:hypothetical protein